MSAPSNSDLDARHLAVRAELNKLRPSSIPQDKWDELMDEQDKQDAATLKAMLKSASQYEADNPDDPVEPAAAGSLSVTPMEEWLASQSAGSNPFTDVDETPGGE